MINLPSFVIFANKINRQTSITSECVEQQKINTFYSLNASYAYARHITSIIDSISLSKNVDKYQFRTLYGIIKIIA